MARRDEITQWDRVELLQRVDAAPSGSRGGVLELRASDIAMVEITDPPLDAVDRIIFVPLSQLRRAV